MDAVRQLLQRIKTDGKRRPTSVKTTAMGRERTFDAFDLGDDTFIIERGVTAHMGERPSVLMVEKQRLRQRARGRVMTISTGNHSVAAFPLLDGRFWKLSRLESNQRSEVLMRSILCANVAQGKIEISQREIPTADLVKTDEWLLDSVGLNAGDIVMGERNEDTLEYYRKRGYEWRVKPLAWTEQEMRVALAAAKKRISCRLSYYHSTRGVHFLSFAEFKCFAELAKTDPHGFICGLKELVSVYEGNRESFTRMPKYRGHHEIELFGLQRGVALERLIPEIERLSESIALGRLGQLGMIQRAEELVALFESLLTRPELADEASGVFTETMYMYITGEIYLVMGEGSTPAFDDRRTALPGATFVSGRPVMHAEADDRTEVLLSNLRGMMSKDEIVEYANVYELRNDDDGELPIGKGKTREVVYKTNRVPLEMSLVEKRLSSAKLGYGSYMFARIGAMRSLGIAMSGQYRLLRRRPSSGKRPVDYYIRLRCDGDPLSSIPDSYFRSSDDSAVEEKGVVLGIARLMGDAAAQNMAMKKFDARTQSPLFGVGKEIYDFEYDVERQRISPNRVSICSIRGSFGWPCLDFSDENLHNLANFYLGHFAHALKEFQGKHTVPMDEVADSFMLGFEFRTRTLAWKLSVMRDQFESYRPGLPKDFNFDNKWKFVMWSLERQERRLPVLRKLFLTKVAAIS